MKISALILGLGLTASSAMTTEQAVQVKVILTNRLKGMSNAELAALGELAIGKGSSSSGSGSGSTYFMCDGTGSTGPVVSTGKDPCKKSCADGQTKTPQNTECCEKANAAWQAALPASKDPEAFKAAMNARMAC